MRKIILLLIVLVSCSGNEFTTETAHFREVCLARGDAWMKMPETVNGQVTGPSCYGCMPNAKTHVCSLDEYETYGTGTVDTDASPGSVDDGSTV